MIYLYMYMKNLRAMLYAALPALLFSSHVCAQCVTISPLPQQIAWGERAFDNNREIEIRGEKTADADAVAALRKFVCVYDAKKTAGDNRKVPVRLFIGKAGDAAVRRYAKLIPERKDGYYLKVTPQEIVVAGRDDAGTFYGVQTLRQIMSSPMVMQCEICDYPSVECRGVIEGFYGNPWSHADRLRQLDFYGENKMNVYVYGPKDDPWHRDRWREPYPEPQSSRIRELAETARRNKVQFVWAIHPGVDIRWTREDSVNVVRKLESMYSLGVRTFAVFFDDIWGEGAKGDKQAGLLNYVTDNFVRKHRDVEPLIMCPTQYNKGWSHGEYLHTLGSRMYPEVRIMWTGNSVVDMIGKEDMEWINGQIGRKAFIWLNYPVNDYCQSRLLMGKTYGNGLDINDMVSGFCSNPMEYAEASKVSLYSIADYTWNMPQYDSNTSWERAIASLMPTCADAFHAFCENNVDLGVTGHGLRREGESPNFTAANIDEMADCFEYLIWAANNVQADSVNHPEMLAEIGPWVSCMRLLGRRGQQYVSMLCALNAGDSVAFVGHYRAQAELERQQKAIVSRNFEGSIVKAKPVVSGDVITPWLTERIARIVKEYRTKHSYGLEYFPVQILEDGEYFIKVDGEFLTDVQAGADRTGDWPVFRKERDMINPQRQQWVIEQDARNGRYKITNKQDGRYINELGCFWRSKNNPYSADWNTYHLDKRDGKWSIQNDGNAGHAFWQREGDRITSGSSRQQFVFEIEKVK